jgi:hypothetical protein
LQRANAIPLSLYLIFLEKASEQVRIVQYDTLFVDGKPCFEAAAVKTLEEIEPIGQPGIGLRLRLNRQVRRKDPSHAELTPLTDCHRRAPNREAVGEGRWPDVDIEATIEILEGAAILVSPVTLSIRVQIQRPSEVISRSDQLSIAKPPR